MDDIVADVAENCRVCGSGTLTDVLDLGNFAVSDFVDDTKPLYAPLALSLCDPESGGCSFVQLKHRAVDRHTLYSRYWYRSGTNETMRAALADVTASAQQVVPLRPGDVVLDIGANDGTLLRSFQRTDIRRIGFEPALNLVAEAESGAEAIVPDFFSAAAFRCAAGDAARARLITSIAMFYDLEDPHEFVRDIAEILSTDGVWIVQMMYLPTMMSRNVFDNICHEHVGYYSLAVMDRLVRAHGLEIVDAELNDVNGGSFRLYIGHRERQVPPDAMARIQRLLAAEQAMGLEHRETYRSFGQRVARLRDDIRAFVVRERSAGKRFHVYGASTKGNTILQYLGLDHRYFELAAERNPQKWGCRTVVTNIPIVSEEVSRSARPDYFFVLPWHFHDNFLAREQPFLAAGGRMVFPLPEPTVAQFVDGQLREPPLRELLG